MLTQHTLALFVIGCAGLFTHFLKNYQLNGVCKQEGKGVVSAMFRYYIYEEQIATLKTVTSFIGAFFLLVVMQHAVLDYVTATASYGLGYMADSALNKAIKK